MILINRGYLSTNQWAAGWLCWCFINRWYSTINQPMSCWLVVLLFYGPSTYFRSFHVRSGTLATLFLLGSLPVLSAHSFASNWQLPFLNQRNRIFFHDQISTKECDWTGARTSEAVTPWFALRLASNCARRPATQWMCWMECVILGLVWTYFEARTNDPLIRSQTHSWPF